MGVAGEYDLHLFTKRLWAWPEEGIRQTDARVELGRHAAMTRRGQSVGRRHRLIGP